MVENLEAICSRHGIDPGLARQCDLLLLPDGITSSTTDLVESVDSITLAKMLKSNGLKCQTMYDLGLPKKVLERRGEELWLGTVWFVCNVVLPTAISVFSNYLYEKAKGALPRTKQSGHTSLLVNVTLIVQKGETPTQLNFSGDVDLLLQILEGLKNDANTASE